MTRSRPTGEPPRYFLLLPIPLLHSLRHLGQMFLCPGRSMPAQFAYPGAFGDLIAALLALTAIPLVARESRGARIMVWIFNIEGTVDLANAMTLATVYGAAPFI